MLHVELETNNWMFDIKKYEFSLPKSNFPTDPDAKLFKRRLYWSLDYISFSNVKKSFKIFWARKFEFTVLNVMKPKRTIYDGVLRHVHDFNPNIVREMICLERNFLFSIRNSEYAVNVNKKRKPLPTALIKTLSEAQESLHFFMLYDQQSSPELSTLVNEKVEFFLNLYEEE